MSSTRTTASDARSMRSSTVTRPTTGRCAALADIVRAADTDTLRERAASGRTARRVAGPRPRPRGRPGAAEARLARLRRALRVVPREPGRAPRLGSGGASLVSEPRREDAPRCPTRGEAFRYWLRLGFISFGGPAGQIAIMHRELVDERRWISERRFLHALNYCMVLPGPEAQQLATYIGWLMHRTLGRRRRRRAVRAPSLLLLIALSWLYVRLWRRARWSRRHSMASSPSWSRSWRTPRGASAGARCAIRCSGRSPRLRSSRCSRSGCRSRRSFSRRRDRRGGRSLRAGRVQRILRRLERRSRRARAAVIDDDTPPPAHARFSKRRLAIVVAACVGLWACSSTPSSLRWQARTNELAHDGRVLHQGRVPHVRRRLCGAALRQPGGGADLRLAHRARR